MDENLSELRDFYHDFLEKIFKDAPEDVTNTRDNLIDYLSEKSREMDFFFDFGATKFVLYEDTRPYVLKIPDTYDRTKNYCEIELQKYHKAEEAHLERYFGWVDYLFDFNDLHIYIMEKVDCNESLISSSFYRAARDNAVSHSSSSSEAFNSDSFDDEWYDRECLDQVEDYFTEVYGSLAFARFAEFCGFNDINDLHSGNWGFRNGDLVAVDYSGYFG